MKKYLIAGNWKMNKTPEESKLLAEEIVSEVPSAHPNVELLVCPPFTSLGVVAEIIKDGAVKLGAQNCHYEPSGAYTGEISLDFLKSFSCEFVIIGHSERRQYFAETDETVNKKTKAAVEKGFTPIVCVGESLEAREKGETFKILEKQIREGLKGINSPNLVIAYEPIWAIGTGISAKPEQIAEAHAFIRERLKELFGEKANEILIQYGGSVKDSNAREILSIENVDGALIGGASLKADSFISIYETAKRLA